MIAALDHRDTGRAIRALAIPTALAMFGDQVLGIADTIAIGSLGTRPLAAIAAATGVFLVLGIGLFGFGSGLRIVGAQAIGAGRSDRFGTIVRSSIVVPALVALLVALAFATFARPLMHAMLPPDVDAASAARYLALRGWSLPFVVVTMQLIVAFATAGDTKLAVRILIAMNVVHIPLLCVLALGWGTHHALGLVGAGMSSLIAEITGVTVALVATARRNDLGVFASWRVDLALVRTTAALSWPDFVFLCLQILPEPIAIALLAREGATMVAAFRALALVNDATWAIPGSIGDACETIVAQRIGARDYAGATTFVRASTRMTVLVCALAGIVIALLAWPLSALFTLDAALANVAWLPLAAHAAITLPLKGYAMTTLAPIRGSGDMRWVMAMGIGATAIAIGGIAFGIVVAHAALWSIPLGWIVSWILRDVATTMRYRGGDWRRRRLAAI